MGTPAPTAGDARPHDPAAPPHAPDLSVMLGGPLYQMYRVTRLARHGLELLHRRLLVLPALAWLPLLVLTLIEGTTWRDGMLSFARDIPAHVRFLVALPLLVFAEYVVHQYMPAIVRQFVDDGLVGNAARARFDAAVASAMRWRNSVAAEVALIVLVYAACVGIVWRHMVAVEMPTWYHPVSAGAFRPTLAGWWFALVSLPLFQFLLLRWYYRLFVWARFLFQVSRSPLDLVPVHPDHMAGLGFLNQFTFAFVLLLLAEGAIASSKFAERIFWYGTTVKEQVPEIVAVVLLFVLMVVCPLLVFAPRLLRLRRRGIHAYGAMGQRYVRAFADKWWTPRAPRAELLGSADIQSLADLANSFEVVEHLQLVPLRRGTLIALVMITLVPFAPLLLTMFSLGDLLMRALSIFV